MAINSFNIQDLPSELIQYTFGFLESPDLLKINRVNKRFYSESQANGLWKSRLIEPPIIISDNCFMWKYKSSPQYRIDNFIFKSDTLFYVGDPVATHTFIIPGAGGYQRYGGGALNRVAVEFIPEELVRLFKQSASKRYFFTLKAAFQYRSSLELKQGFFCPIFEVKPVKNVMKIQEDKRRPTFFQSHTKLDFTPINARLKSEQVNLEVNKEINSNKCVIS